MAEILYPYDQWQNDLMDSMVIKARDKKVWNKTREAITEYLINWQMHYNQSYDEGNK